MRTIKAIAVSICAVALGMSARPACAQTLVADYQLQGTYNSAVGTIGPLSVVGTAADVAFTTGADVDGNTQTVLSVNVNNNNVADAGAGVQAQTAGFLSASNYSVVLLADFNLAPDLVATKVFDFKNLSSDAGLYINDTTGLLYFNGATGATGTQAALTSTYTQIVLTRDSTTNLVTVYENGSQDFQFDDTTGLAILGDSVSPSSNAYLTAFKDDGTGVGSTLVNETSVGDIARLRLYDGVLTPAEVAPLDTTIPEPVASSLMFLSGALLLRRRARR